MRKVWLLLSVIALSSCVPDGPITWSKNSDKSPEKPTSVVSSKTEESLPVSSPDSTPVSSSESSESSTEESSSSSDHIYPSEIRYYRVAVNDIKPDQYAQSADVYSVTWNSSKHCYEGEVISALRRSGVNYTDPDDVAAYCVAFNAFPQNYLSQGYYGKPSEELEERCLSYGTSGRLASKWSFRTGGGSDDYTTNMGGRIGYDYYELDVGGNNYNNGYSINRGTNRIIFCPRNSCSLNNNDPVCFYTTDHYKSFIEYWNHEGGWSPKFAGTSSSYGSRTAPTTIEFTKLA